MKDTFRRIIIDFQERTLRQTIKRDIKVPLTSDKIVTLIGVRRCGKTSILYKMIEELRESVDPQNIVYINFEDDRLFGTTLHDLDDLIEGYFELYPAKRDERVYLFFDEVQNISGWELFIRRIYDTLNVQITLTGSSSKLLSSEIATSLRGRTLSYEVFPFSFKEYLRFKNIKVNLDSSKSLSFIKHSFDEYLVSGGFPETIGQDSSIQKRILSDYVNLIVYKDIIERYNISNTVLLKHLIKYTFVNIATSVSITKLYNDFKSNGFKLGKETLFDYFGYLEDAYALFSIPIFRSSVREEQRNPKKIYAIDNGLRAVYDASFSPDYSKLYENLVFLALRSQTSEVYYVKENQETDFYCVINGKKKLINVSYEIDNSKTFDREINSLSEGMDYVGCDYSLLITKDKEGTINVGTKLIEFIPLWKWLLNETN
ncbi:MAG: ATP-binding protein [Thiovulaceae bacterium]|nr:ATP-binding protein [Sulfurimonadaceae bacterium]